MNTISAMIELATNGKLVLLRVLSRHQHALNLITPTNLLFAIVTPYHGNGPFHIVISPAQLAQLQQLSTIFLYDYTIQAGPFTLPFAHFARWDPHLPTLATLPANSFQELYQCYRELGQPALGVVALTQDNQPTVKPIPSLHPSQVDRTAQLAYQRANHAVTAISSGLYEENIQLIADGVKLLAGLGPGLTPAGDDFLVGLLAAFYALGPRYAQSQWPAWQVYAHIIAHTALTYTTQLSAAWLTYAGGGAFGEAWHNLIHAINTNQAQAIIACAARILTTGATSGADAMSGFLWGIAMLKRRAGG